MGDGVGRVLAEAPGEGVIEAGNGDLDAGGDEFGWLRQQAVVGVVIVSGIGEHGAKNYRDVFGAQQILHFVGLSPASKHHAKFLFIAIFDGIAYVAGAIGEDENGKLAANDGDKGFELYIAFEIGRTAVAHGLGVMTSAF